jgi:hypothetical protein
MIVLTRQRGQEVVDGGTIRIAIAGIKGDKFRIGIEAPPVVCVDHRAVHERRGELGMPSWPFLTGNTRVTLRHERQNGSRG